ncbi:hypothetical protein GcM1_250267 [Golovinomyces cichoracearum]|uniref:Uncharacterized protein n=1 Tax=Golovinomyces cichoracearum TaxID=62708 RepID=A0A420IBD2_9PEZI|nr:hypothetical protein GcM1_250267 [Golovinomyces cichoracearum]
MRLIPPNSQQNDLYNSRQDRNQTTRSQNPSVPNYQAPNQRKIEIPVGYDRSTSSNPYVNESKVMNGEQVCLICENSRHVESPGISKDNYLSNDFEIVNFDLLGYEPAGSKRVRIDRDDDSDDEYGKLKRAIKANEREQFERQSCRQKKEKKRKLLDTISDTTQRNLNSKSIPKTSIPFAESSKRKSETKLRNIFGREGKGPFHNKKMLENTIISMSMMDIYQPMWNLEPEEELLVEVSSSLVKVGGYRETVPKQNGDKLKIDCLTVSSPKIPTVDLMTTPIIRKNCTKRSCFLHPWRSPGHSRSKD